MEEIYSPDVFNYPAWSISFILYAEEKPLPGSDAGTVLSRVEAVLKFPEGELIGTMLYIKPGGDARLYGLEVDVSGADTLFKFSTDMRGAELSVLFNKNEDIWEFNPVINKLSNKRWAGLFDPILSSNFYFIDLYGIPFEKNFSARTAGSASVNNIECLKIELVPKIKEFRYGLIAIYIKKNDNIPIKIEFCNIEKEVFKTMTIDNVLKQNDKDIPMRYEMSDLLNGSSTIIEFSEYYPKKKLDKKIFNHANMGEE